MSINLSGTSAAARVQKSRDASYIRAVFLTILALAVLVGSYIALIVYNKTLEGEISSIERNIDLREAEISNAQSIRVANAIYRAQDMQKYTRDNSVPLEIIDAVGQSIAKDVTLSSYIYEVDASSDMVILEFQALDLISIARQIEALKQVQIFSDVALKGTRRNADTNNVEFTVTLLYTAQ